MSMLEHALTYARRGWSVFPVHSFVDGYCTCGNLNCSSPGKHPVDRGGFKTATQDEDQLHYLFGGTSPLNIGIATGAISGIYVVDIDVKSTVNGLETLRRLEAANSRLDKSSSVLTGSGGWHFYLPTHGRSIQSNAGRVGPGIDIRGDGGYVVAPPSIHKSGNTYKWEVFHE